MVGLSSVTMLGTGASRAGLAPFMLVSSTAAHFRVRSLAAREIGPSDFMAEWKAHRSRRTSCRPEAFFQATRSSFLADLRRTPRLRWRDFPYGLLAASKNAASPTWS